jgi:glucose-1-phosphate thymidylyltransferase
MTALKGILLAGGRGTRLYPLTAVASKQLQPIYNKPMVYYSLTTLLVAGVREILVLSSPEDTPRFRALLGDGARWGLRLEYAVQDEPRGIADALLLGAEFLGDASVVLMLGDNLIYGRLDFLRDAIANNGEGATIFAYRVADPSAYGVVEFDPEFRVLSLEEKPARPRSHWAVPGIYVYGPGVAARAATLHPSARGELEITDLNRTYLRDRCLRALPMGRGVAWLDTGTPEALLHASNFVHTLEARQGLVIGCPEEAAARMGFLSVAGLRRCLEAMPAGAYRSYLEGLAEEFEGELHPSSQPFPTGRPPLRG